jgi:ferrous iron transport protein B
MSTVHLVETKTRKIAVVGNPNTGKTTLFNGITRGNQKIGNWPGVTVEKITGTLKADEQDITVVDLPGIYCLSANSEDEIIARDYILSGEPELVVNIVDASNLERNLFLTTNLLEMNVPVLLVLNMMDVAKNNGISIDTKLLEKELNVPVVPISATEREGIDRVVQRIQTKMDKKAEHSAEISYPNEIETVISQWSDSVQDIAARLGTTARWVCTKLLEGDTWITEKVVNLGAVSKEEIEQKAAWVESMLNDTPDVIIAEYTYGFIQGIAKSVIKKTDRRQSISERIDKLAMHKLLGIPIFLGVMYLVFWLTMSVGGAFIDFFDIFFGTIFVDGFAALLGALSAPEWLVGILANGIGAGIQTVATFIPIIFMMFLMISLLEDSGYMARAAFVMDRFMRWLGLPGKAFIPMLVGFGCTIPAVMATRTLENKKDRYLTIFMAPCMSCGARLPVYALFAAAFFPGRPGLVVFSIYMAGILVALITGLVLKNTLFKGEPSHFVMELPPYHPPRLRHIMFHTWNRLKIFMFRAGKVIIIVVAILSFFSSLGVDGSFGNEDSDTSVLAKIGKTITPIFRPMGIEEDNWPATVSIFTGLFAKEAVVGTLNSLYSQIEASTAAGAGVSADGTTEEPETLPEAEAFSFWSGIGESFTTIPENLSGVFTGLSDPLGVGMIAGEPETVAEEVEADTSIYASMRYYFNAGPLQAYAFLLFILIYFPCVAALGAIIREMGRGFGWLIVGYLTLMGWIVATLFYQLTVAHQAIWIVIPIILLGAIYALFAVLGRRQQTRVL